MADRVTVEIGGKSKYEVARDMADVILFSYEKKPTTTRKEYLQTVAECMQVLNGGFP